MYFMGKNPRLPQQEHSHAHGSRSGDMFDHLPVEECGALWTRQDLFLERKECVASVTDHALLAATRANLRRGNDGGRSGKEPKNASKKKKCVMRNLAAYLTLSLDVAKEDSMHCIQLQQELSSVHLHQVRQREKVRRISEVWPGIQLQLCTCPKTKSIAKV